MNWRRYTWRRSVVTIVVHVHWRRSTITAHLRRRSGVV